MWHRLIPRAFPQKLVQLPSNSETVHVSTVRNLSIKGSGAQKSSTIVEVLSFANQKGWLKTMESIIKVGQRFKFTVLTDDAPSERQAVVVQVLSNQEKGLGLDVDQYMSYWVEARELPETESSTILVFVRSMDGKVYLDGKLTDVTVLP
jgi:hypothetical protein